MIRLVAKLAGILALVGAVAAFGLAFTYCVTRENIERQIREAQMRAVRGVMPRVTSDEGVRELAELPSPLREKFPGVEKAYEGFVGEEPAGLALLVRSRGYGGPVVLMVGIDEGPTVGGLGIVEHRETPGLGNYIENASWREQFKGKGPEDPLKPNKDIDAVSGATISAKAVARGVREALEASLLLGGGQ